MICDNCSNLLSCVAYIIEPGKPTSIEPLTHAVIPTFADRLDEALQIAGYSARITGYNNAPAHIKVSGTERGSPVADTAHLRAGTAQLRTSMKYLYCLCCIQDRSANCHQEHGKTHMVTRSLACRQFTSLLALYKTENLIKKLFTNIQQSI